MNIRGDYMKVENIGKNINKIREKRGIKQEILAKAVGIETSNISQYENGKTIPKLKTLIKIASYLDTTIDYLLSDTDD